MGKSLDELASYFRPEAEVLIQRAIDAGLDPVVEDTGRTLSEQAVKLLQGVSWTKHSKHLPQPPEMKSEAIDIVPRECIGLKLWGWSGKVATSHPHWGALIRIVESLGLASGVHYGDPGHAEWKHPTIPPTTA